MWIYLWYHLVLLFIHSYYTPKKESVIEVRVIDISGRGRNSCKPLMKTDFFEQYSSEYPTLFYNFLKKYSIGDEVCLKGLDFDEGQTVVLKIDESPFGMSVSNIKAKVY